MRIIFGSLRQSQGTNGGGGWQRVTVGRVRGLLLLGILLIIVAFVCTTSLSWSGVGVILGDCHLVGNLLLCSGRMN